METIRCGTKDPAGKDDAVGGREPSERADETGAGRVLPERALVRACSG